MKPKSLSISIANPVTQTQLKQLRTAVGPGPVLITTHANPDPDALASGLALFELLKTAWNIPSQLLYCGQVGRAENRTILRLLTPEWEYVDNINQLERFSAVALVDSQPGAGNNNLPCGVIPTLVFDHHIPIRPESRMVSFADIRTDVGSTTTILFQYLAAANISVPARLATAMFYGLRTDTNGLTRNASASDGVVYALLHETLDQQLLIQVQLSGLSRQYFDAFNHGLHHAWVAGQAITSFLGNIHRPDLVAEMADLLLRMEDIHTALCLGRYENTLYISLRTGLTEPDAGLLIQKIIPPSGKAGGNGTIAGGQIVLNGLEDRQVVADVQTCFLEVVGEGGTRTPLLKNGRKICLPIE